MNVNFSKTVISATQFVDCCKKLDIQGNLSDSDLKAIYSCADKYGYDIVLAENYQDCVEHLSIYELFSKYLDWGCLKDIGMEMGVSQDSIDATLNDDDDKEKDEIINLVITYAMNNLDKEDFANIVESYLSDSEYVVPVLSEGDRYDFLLNLVYRLRRLLWIMTNL